MNAQADPKPGSGLLAADRLASLGDTVFGVAMTLLATTLVLPLPGAGESAFQLLLEIRGPLWAVLLSFAISASFWTSQQRRLALFRTLTPHQTRLHLVFLFLIVLLPISTNQYGRASASRPVVLIYGTHLALLGIANLLLWMDVHRRVASHGPLLGAGLLLGLFAAALAVGTEVPTAAQYFWLAAFAVAPVSRALDRRRLRVAPPRA